MNKMRLFALASFIAIAFGSSASRAAAPPRPSAGPSVTIQVTDASLREVLKSIATQSGRDFFVESTVPYRKLTLNVMNVPVDDALDFISARPADFQWRRISLPPNSPLLDSADELAKAARQNKGATGPSMAFMDPMKKTAAISVRESDTGPITSALKSAGWVEVYLISNDAAAAPGSPKSPPPTLDDYTTSHRAQADTFLAFGPDDRRKAALFDLSLILDSSLGYGNALLKSLAGSADGPANSNPLPLALARYVDGRSLDQPPIDSLVEAIPRDMLPRIKSELVKILTTVDARLKRKTDTPSHN